MRVPDLHRLLDAATRRDFQTFVGRSFHHVSPMQTLSDAWYIGAITYQLDRCRRGEIRRLLITMPPRYLKSICASVAFPAYLLGHDPTNRIICVSYSAELAAKHARDCRSIMGSPWYQRIFPLTRLSAERNAGLDFMTTSRGFRLSTSVGGTLTGRGGNVVIVDDPMKPDEAFSEVRRAGVAEWFDSTLVTRLDNKQTDVMIVIMQRLHQDDLVGHILSKEEEWEHLDLPAIAEADEIIQIGPGRFHRRRAGEPLDPAREPLPTLAQIRASMGSFNFSAQYQQRPIPAEGELIKLGWFGTYDRLPHQNYLFQSWDTAQKAGELNDYSVCTTWVIADGNLHLADVFRDRLPFPQLKQAAIAQQQKWRSHVVLIEDKGSGTSLIQELQRGELRGAGRPVAITPEADKVTRAAACSAMIESGRVFLPREAPWLEAFRTEVLQFPNGKHDDQIDSMSQFLNYMNGLWRRGGGVTLARLGGI